MTTNYANASYQEVIDLHTESDTVSVVGIHTPCASTPKKMLSGFFDQFKKYKYNGCNVVLVPAARLPADPSQVSYGAGEAPIDPRDMLNPILFHGCHGNDMGNILNQFYNDTASSNPSSEISVFHSDSIEQNQGRVVNNTDYLLQLYYRALTDTTWQKAHPQKGFRKSGLRPLVYGLSTDLAMLPMMDRQTSYMPHVRGMDANGAPTSYYGGAGGQNNSASAAGISATRGPGYFKSEVVDEDLTFTQPAGTMGRQVFTNRLQPLGWMETTEVVGQITTAETIDDYDSNNVAIGKFLMNSHVQYTAMPRIFMGMVLLPPAYKTEQYFRLIINHNFSFKGFRGVSMLPRLDTSVLVNTPSYFDFEDSNDRSIGPDEKYPLPCDDLAEPQTLSHSGSDGPGGDDLGPLF